MNAQEVLAKAIAEYDPVAVFAMFSGGDDSICALHVAMQHPRFTAAVFVNTGTGVPQTIEHVRATVQRFGVKLLEYEPLSKNYEWYLRRFGFPGPGQHTNVYRWLKLRQVERLVREHKQSRTDRVLLVTGVRKQESVRRMGTVDVVKRVGAQVWVAPLVDWSHDDKWAYIESNGIIPSPVAANLHMSGECLCGAYAKPGEKEMIRFFYPDVAARIDGWEQMVFASGREHVCRWGEKPREAMADGQAWLPLCQDCPTRWAA